MTQRSVAIFGAGIGGLSAAQELAERGLRVTVYEADAPGGKARSIPVPGTGTSGRPDLPGEHGFRFFPAFYRHVTDTMARIPYGRGTVVDNLVQGHRIRLSRFGRPDVHLTARFPETSAEWGLLRHTLFGDPFGLSAADVRLFCGKLLRFLATCEERRFAELEGITWWDYVEAEGRSPAYGELFATGLTRCLTAMRPKQASARTVATILVQLLVPFFVPTQVPDRVLCGPTNEVWIQPWLDHLRNLGVTFRYDQELLGFDTRGGAIAAARVVGPGGETRIRADQYVAAVPAEVMARITDPALAALDPALGRIGALRTEWMVGAQYFLKRDISLCYGHTIYIHSPWAITSVSEAQFWPRFDLQGYGDGTVRGVLSVDISDWDERGRFNGKRARDCTQEEVLDEVWAEIKAHINESGEPPTLRDQDVHSRFLDPGIEFPANGPSRNRTPLLVNTPGSWANRPDAVTRVPNLYLAADYVRTKTDLASMEAANEAARLAVNGLLTRCRVSAEPCAIFPLRELRGFGLLRAMDRARSARVPAAGAWDTSDAS